MADSSPTSKYLGRRLDVFDLPPELLNSLVPLSSTSATDLANSPRLLAANSNDEASSVVKEADSNDAKDNATGPTTGKSCALCSLNFADVQDQRNHVKSDLHGYNLKQKLQGRKVVDEAEFERLLEEIDESISGSDSGESESETEAPTRQKDTTLSNLLKNQARLSSFAEDEPVVSTKRKQHAGEAPIHWFKSPLLPQKTILGVYQAVFASMEHVRMSDPLDELREKQLSSNLDSAGSSKQGHYFLCMIGGGHFAAMIVGLTPKITKSHNSGSDRKPNILAHKTFHRYTTRRKQGGSQSANDAAKGAAHSAGSSLRRYNEATLVNEVRELLSSWKAMIASADLLFVRATGTTNRRTLFGPYEDVVLKRNDSRLRRFPFSTRRATQSELVRSFLQLTSVRVSQIEEAVPTAQKTSQARSEAKQHASPAEQAAKQAKPTPEEEESILHTTQMTALIKRGKAQALSNYISSNSIPPAFNFHPPSKHHHAPTPLHFAASSNQPSIVLALLTKAGSDPTIRNEEGKTAFDLAGDRATRDAFRAARGEIGEEKWSWQDAGVPNPLSKADVERREERERKERETNEQAEKKRREVEMERLKSKAQTGSSGTRQIKSGLGAASKTGAEKREEEARGLTPESRARLERERRARAAEERLKRMQGST